MSLAGLHSPHVSMSSDFSSTLGLADLMADYEAEQQGTRIPPQSPRIDERTPFLVNGAQKEKERAPTRLNATLLLTIVVVTIGSSFQFGYATGECCEPSCCWARAAYIILTGITITSSQTQYRRHE